MEFKKEVVIVLGILFLILFLNNADKIITGKASSIGNIENSIMENEYLLYVNEPKWIEGVMVKLISVSENNDAIVSINGEIRSISDSIIMSNGLQIQKNVAIKETKKKSFAVLKIIKVEQGKNIGCRETDNGNNIYLKGICYDNYYNMGIEDYCDGKYLREFSCKYDSYVNEIHCMREIVRCNNICREGKCVSEIKAY